MQHTTNYNLNQWEADDVVRREDVNADNAKIDTAVATRGNCQVVYGTYVGTGKYGEANPNILTFDHMPMLLAVHMRTTENSVFQLFAVKNTAFVNDRIIADSFRTIYIEWHDKYVKWSSDNPAPQMNSQNIEYHYLVLLDTDH